MQYCPQLINYEPKPQHLLTPIAYSVFDVLADINWSKIMTLLTSPKF